jgi:small-conductance mechanosensitive channel
VAVVLGVVAALIALEDFGVNTVPLLAGASVLGLAVSFGSQTLVRDIVSGIFFLAEDSFRVGEYIDGTKVKGTVEGFSVRSIRLRHQNGQLHIVPFGQLTHITNFSRDWTTVKFNLAFAINTDVELLRKTVKKIGLEMMTEPQWQKELLQPLKMQGLVDIKDASLIVRFKFTAKPKNPSMIQRQAIRRMYDSLPKLGIEFARPPYAAFPYGAMDPAQRAAAQ